ncbi:MAG: heme-binding domain-containing protein [bacterium]|nr:heme-binding domain-containing protein [bacterium]
MTHRTRRAAAWTAGAALTVFLAAQLVRPELPSGPVDHTVDVPPDVLAVLRRACFDCHSNETRLPWFDRIVPAYWLVVADVREGREHLNFSELGARPVGTQRAALWEAINHVRLGAMPPWRYTLVHRDAAPSPADVALVEAWLRTLAPPPKPASAQAPAPLPPRPATVRPAPNGLAFQPDYRDWRLVDGSERFDNGTLRQILGNDVAMRAIADGAFPPWPDGTTFAKVTWETVVDADGVLRGGSFVQVELMAKDAARWAATDGWGWGRWRGAGFEPYGTDAAFAGECVGCHAPMRDADYVFTPPLDRRLAPAGVLPVDPLAWRVVAAAVDPAADTMATLFGDAAAVAAARAGTPVPPDASLARVTWRRRDDPSWFGARIPGALEAVEVVRDGVYRRWEGAPLAVAPTDPAGADARARALREAPRLPFP